MQEQFPEASRRVMMRANQEAMRWKHEYIGTEHILLAILDEDAGTAMVALKNLGIDIGKFRRTIEKLIQLGPNLISMGKMPPTPRAKKVIEHALAEAKAMGHGFVDPEHLLLGLLCDQESFGCKILENEGLTLDRVRKAVHDALRQAEPGAAGDVQAALKQLDAEIEKLEEDKIDAVARQDFELASILRNRERSLKRKRADLDANHRDPT